MNEPAPPACGGQLDPELRRYGDLVKEHELVFDLVENGVYPWPAGGENDFAILRIRKNGG